MRTICYARSRPGSAVSRDGDEPALEAPKHAPAATSPPPESVDSHLRPVTPDRTGAQHS
jgi:hypothetical protein